MSLIVEDGTGVEDADSYLTLVDARALAEKYNLTISSDDTTADGQLRQGYFALLNYEPQTTGYQSNADQTGLFPRTGCVKNNTYSIASDAIPSDVKNAQVFAAAAINGGVDMNAVKDSPDLAGFSVGRNAYSETYQQGKSQPTIAVMAGVSRWLNPYFKSASLYVESY